MKLYCPKCKDFVKTKKSYNHYSEIYFYCNWHTSCEIIAENRLGQINIEYSNLEEFEDNKWIKYLR